MEFKNSISILFSNIGYVFKLLVWILISALITAGLGAAILIPIWRELVATTDIAAHVENFKAVFQTVWNGSINLRAAAHKFVPEFINSVYALNQNAGMFAALIICVLFLYALYCFLRGLSFYSLSDIVNTLMTTNMRYGLASNMALNMKKNVRFSFCRLAISFPIDVAFIAAAIAMSLSLYKVIGFFALPILLIVSVVFCSLRATLFGAWLPRLLYHRDERMFTAFSRSLVYVKYNFIDLFKAYATIFTIVYLFSYLCGAPTGGLAMLVILPMHYFLLRAVELVGYFKMKGASFYTDGSTVVNTVEYGLRLANQHSDDMPADIDKRMLESGDKEDEQ